jgi:hypothetical protein
MLYIAFDFCDGEASHFFEDLVQFRETCSMSSIIIAAHKEAGRR